MPTFLQRTFEVSTFNSPAPGTAPVQGDIVEPAQSDYTRSRDKSRNAKLNQRAMQTGKRRWFAKGKDQSAARQVSLMRQRVIQSKGSLSEIVESVLDEALMI